MTLPTGSLTTLAIVKTELNISSSTDDTYLERLIGASTAFISSYCNRTFHYGTGIAEEVAGFGTQYLQLSRAPVLSITSVTYDGQTINSDNYSIDGDGSSGMLYAPAGWTWSTIGGQGIIAFPKPGGEEKLYTVTYTGGYVTEPQVSGQLTRTLPYDLEDAVIQLTTYRYRQRGRDQTIASESLLNASVSYRSPVVTASTLKSLLPLVHDVLEAYRHIPLL
jgi:hypothetical protein